VRRHLLQKLALEAATTFVGFYLADQALRRWDDFFGFRGLADFANLPLLILVGAALSLFRSVTRPSPWRRIVVG
jgi:hypothetical protein